MKLHIAILSAALVSNVFGARVESLSWVTQHACAPTPLANGGDQFLPPFRATLNAEPEAVIVPLALSQPALLGLPPSQAATLQPLVADRYRLMSESAVYAKTVSLLPYSFSERKPTQGAASLYVPDHPGPSSPVILFLHGYGGSFLWYQHWLSEAFPNAIILCPAYGVSPASVSPEYLRESLAAAARHLGFALSSPALVGLSAGGFGACRAYAAAPEIFSQLVCLGAYPPDDTLRRFPRKGMALFLAGGEEPFVVSRQLQASVQTIRSTCPRTTVQIIPQADHFFMLTHPQPTRQAMKMALSH